MQIRRKWNVSAGIVLAVTAVVLAFSGCSTNSDQPVAPQQQANQSMTLGQQGPGVQHAMDVQNKYNEALMRLNDVVGVGTGLDEEGQPDIVVFTKTGANHNLPSVVEGIPVHQEVIGEIVAYQYNPNAKGGKAGPPGGGGGSGIDPKGWFARPVPIGVSTGNINECSSGTISCRVTDGSKVYALSNNHVYALENHASINDECVQPGRYDRNCTVTSSDVFATLSAYKPIVFTTSAGNDIDASIAETSTTNLGTATPGNGYGQPNHITATPTLNMQVMKYGRTTGQTAGYIVAVNATVNVSYTYGTAQFINQLVIYPSSRKKKFSAAGDSGSLIVTNDSNNNPVGLLFAGSNTSTIANPIGPVLSYFGVTIQGK